MKLKDILKNINCEIFGDENINVENLSHNSKEENHNGIFFAINGGKVNGEDFINEAIKNGAKVIVSENKIKTDITNVVVDDIRKAMSLLAGNFYLNPANSMLIIGVTGTNGKTTTTYMMKSIFEKAGKKVGVIGTNGIVINNQKYESSFTTPDPILLQKYLAKMKENKVNVVCMETSAHALELQKLWGVMTDIALFTNLTQDHLDFFKTMDNYFESKRKYFTNEYSRFGVVNVDDYYGKLIFENAQIPLITVSRKKNNDENYQSDITANNEQHNNSNQTFDVKSMKGDFSVKLNMLGGFNVSNALLAIAAALMADIDKKHIIDALENLEMVEGRFNTIDVDGVKVVVDYAHTPDGLENILKSAREITQGKLISVFGCGGNRDRDKRHKMGEISSKLADVSILTSDNPRNENPINIIKDIQSGFKGGNYIIEDDRVSAIKTALEVAKKNDTIVILGKGQEKYIDIDNRKIPYVGDLELVKDLKKKIENRFLYESILL